MRISCQDGSIDVTPDYTDDVVSLVARDCKGCQVNLTLSRAKALLLAVEIDNAERCLAEYDDD